MSRYVVGIDLGTTNCALAYADTREATPDAPAPIRTFAIPQVVGVNDVAERPVLPSFLYLPAAKEFPPGATDLPWKSPPGPRRRARSPASTGRRCRAGSSARPRAGSRTPASTAAAAILPWTAAADVAKVSPVEASTAYLDPPPRRLEPAGSPARRPPTGSSTRTSS